jgi:hypothetical protein
MFRAAYQDSQAPSLTEGTGELDAFVAAQVLSEWHQNPRFLTSTGAAAPLNSEDFERLCRTASATASARMVLQLLSEAGAVQMDSGVVSPLRRELILGDNHPEGVKRAVALSAGFASTLNHNLTRSVRDPRRFERTVVNTRLAKRHIPPLLAYLSVHGQSFLEDLDAWMSARESGDSGPTIGVGVYLFVSDPSSDPR